MDRKHFHIRKSLGSYLLLAVLVNLLLPLESYSFPESNSKQQSQADVDSNEYYLGGLLNLFRGGRLNVTQLTLKESEQLPENSADEDYSDSGQVDYDPELPTIYNSGDDDDDYNITELSPDKILSLFEKYNDSGDIQNDEYDSDWFIRSMIFELIIFICCAAGVFGLCSLCCVVCGHIFEHTVGENSQGRNSSLLPYSSNRAMQFEHEDDDGILTFIAIHRNPWSPGVLDGEQNHFFLENSEDIDLPPAYEDLDLTKKSEEPCSPPPPPYTPSLYSSVSEQNKNDVKGEGKLI